MLTKNDLEQIRGVVREEVKAEVGSQIQSIKSDVDTIKKEVATSRKEVGAQIEGVKTDISTVKKDVATSRKEVGAQIEGVKADVRKQLTAQDKRFDKKLRKMQNAIIQYHDEYAIYLRERIEKLEEHTGLV